MIQCQGKNWTSLKEALLTGIKDHIYTDQYVRPKPMQSQPCSQLITVDSTQSPDLVATVSQLTFRLDNTTTPALPVVSTHKPGSVVLCFPGNDCPSGYVVTRHKLHTQWMGALTSRILHAFFLTPMSAACIVLLTKPSVLSHPWLSTSLRRKCSFATRVRTERSHICVWEHPGQLWLVNKWYQPMRNVF